jgi:hydrogenase nickel incorporation protein HypB
MCTVCGCGAPELGHTHDHGHDHPDGSHHAHGHDHGHGHGHDHRHRHDATLDFGAGIAGSHVTGMSQERIVRIERNILSLNDGYAAANRERLAGKGILALNLMSSPGAGKTTLLARTIRDLSARLAIAVIEGDQQTAIDADRIRAAGAAAIQINTGKGCHLDAHMVGHAIERLAPPAGGLLFIENVGNLVCPAAFDLGEDAKVVTLSVTEGDDKPLKYPDMFAAAGLMVIAKIDLLPHVDFDVAACLAQARRVNPGIATIELSARTGQGLDGWYRWIEERLSRKRASALVAAS